MPCLGDLPAPLVLTARSKAAVIDQRRAPFRHRQPHQMPRGRVSSVQKTVGMQQCTCDLGPRFSTIRRSGIRGSREISTVRVDEMYPTMQRIIVLRLIFSHSIEELRTFCGRVTLCPGLSWPRVNSPRCCDSCMLIAILEPWRKILMPSTGVRAPVIVSFQGAWVHALRLGMHLNICKGLPNLRRRR
jgi:hypothetical protein